MRNDPLFNEMLDALRGIAEEHALIEDGDDGPCCILCRARVQYRGLTQVLLHDDDCPYVVARAVIAEAEETL